MQIVIIENQGLMKHTQKITAIAAAMILLAAASHTTAQTANPSANSSDSTNWTYNSSGYILPTVLRMNPDNRFNNLQSGNGGGLRLGNAMSPNWDVQLGLQYGHVNDSGNRLEQATLGLDGLYMFSRSNFRPLILIGAGAQLDRLKTPTSQASSTSPLFS